ncbi:MAG: putative peptidase [Prokaryotic dsDNA virus sp.]|nr:MAG: putative peptidase [Prokaryotic dsDNA virus sp.]
MAKKDKIVELIIDDNDEMSGVNAISVVESPAIEELFIALNDQTLLKAVDKKRGVLVGPALIPNKKIFRVNPKTKEEFYIFFSEDTVRKASEKFFIEANQSNATLEHKKNLKGMTVVESWIIEGENDKSKDYGMNLPVGTWMVSMKVTDEIYKKAENQEIKGFSIEGFFADELEAKMYTQNQIQELRDLLKLETYNDYPESAKNNAKKVLRWREEHGDEVKGMTRTGWTRANQLAKGENISRSTISRMASFKRHQKNAEVSAEFKSTPWKDRGYVAWLGWGGTSGINWAISKLKSIDNKKK